MHVVYEQLNGGRRSFSTATCFTPPPRHKPEDCECNSFLQAGFFSSSSPASSDGLAGVVNDAGNRSNPLKLDLKSKFSTVAGATWKCLCCSGFRANQDAGSRVAQTLYFSRVGGLCLNPNQG